MEGEELNRLVADIKANGLLHPVITLDGEILDGRNRYTACQLAKVECRFVEIDPVPDDISAYVFSENGPRRHLQKSQWAMIGANMESYREKAKERMKAGGGDKKSKIAKSGPVHLPDPINQGDSRDQIGEVVGVSGRMIDKAVQVKTKGTPQLVKAVEQGRMSLSRAAGLTGQRPEIQDEIAESAQSANSQYCKPKAKSEKPHTAVDTSKSKALQYAHQAIDALKRIPKNDPLRKRGFQIVTDWIKANKEELVLCNPQK